MFRYSDTWQLVINTGTTIVTFLMVFLIQRSQNKDSLAIHLKLNEIVAALNGASNRLIDVESLSEKELAQLHRYLPRAGDALPQGERPHHFALGRGGATAPLRASSDATQPAQASRIRGMPATPRRSTSPRPSISRKSTTR